MAMQQEEFRQEIRSIIRDEFEKYCRTQPIQNSGNFDVYLSS